MLGTLVLLFVCANPDEATFGQVTATIGQVQLRRGDRAFTAGIRSSLQGGERIETAQGGGAGLFLYEGQSIALGPITSVTLPGRSAAPALELTRGEVRTTVAGPGAMTVATPSARALVRRGIVRASVSPTGTRLWAEQGSAEVFAGDRLVARMERGQEIFIPARETSKGPSPATGQGWTIRVEDLQLAGAAASSRRLKRGQVGMASDRTAVDFLPSGQLPDVAASTPSDATTPPTTDATPPATDVTTPPTTDATPPTTDADSEAYQPIAVSQPNAVASTSTVSLALGNISPSSFAGASGGFNVNAQQQSSNRVFPGYIYPITNETSYTLTDVRLRGADRFPEARQFWSIGLGDSPTGQVTTSMRTASAPNPVTIRIPRADAYLVHLAQFSPPDPASTIPSTSTPEAVLGITGLLGTVPISPVIVGATPLRDPQARFNDRMTFAFGEFAVGRDALNDIRNPQFGIRHSDQDRQIIKAPGSHDDLDIVTPNPDVAFVDVPEPKFSPTLPTVKVPVPNSFQPRPTYGRLDPLRKAAATTLIADSLYSSSRRTGQTRFVIDGQIVDISGYQPSASLPRLPGGSTNLLRQGGPISAGTAAGRGPMAAGPRGR